MDKEKAVARKLLAVERDNLASVKANARVVIDSAVARISLSTSFDNKIDTRAAMRAVQTAIPAMTTQLASSIEAARIDARSAGRDASSEDFGDDVDDAEVRASEEDGARAWAAASAFAAFWGAVALTNVKKAGRLRVSQGTSVRRAMVATVRETSSRLERVVVTETVHAFNAEREAVALEVNQLPRLVAVDGAGPYRTPGTRAASSEPIITRTWSAILDLRVCDRCASLHGTRRELGEDFPEGFEPPLHPFCRCILVYEKKNIANAA